MSVQLLVSVRSAEEAEEALRGGASVIDVKEPSRGPMGRADDSVVASVIRAVAGQRPVSAALGEFRDSSHREMIPEGLSFVKWGLARCAGWRWQGMLCVPHLLPSASARKVLVAYADEENAQSPPLERVAAFVCVPDSGWVLLVDTFAKHRGKDRPTLLDWADEATLGRLCERCREAAVPLALAGSLGVDEIRRLLPLGPTLIGVRGAVCAGGDRNETVRAELVQQIAALF